MASGSGQETPLPSTSEGMGPKRRGGERRKRTIYTKEQLEVLKKVYQTHPYPSFFMRQKLEQLLGIQEPRIHVWFQNKRARDPETHHACKRQKKNPYPEDQPPAQNISIPASSLPETVWNLPCPSAQNWDSDHQGGIYSHSSSFGAGPTAPTPQMNLGLDAVNSGMLSPLESAVNLPMGPQPSQQATSQPDVNYFKTQQSMSWTHGNMQQGDQITPNYPYSVSPQTPYDMSYHMNYQYLNYNQTTHNNINGSIQY